MRARSQQIAPTKGIGLFAVFVFVLTAVPRLSVKFGPVPIYFLDLLIGLMLLMALNKPGFTGRHRPFAFLVGLIFLFAIAGEVAGLITGGRLLETVYIVGRTTLAFSVFYITTQFIRNAKDLEVVLKAAILGVIVTACLMILTSLPQTRGAITGAVFSIPMLEPAASSVVEKYIDSGEGGVRGRTLVGVSILGATFLNILWPHAALLLRWPVYIGSWRWIAGVACLLAPMGVIMSYSRGPILGSILLILAAVVLSVSRVRRGILLPVLLSAGLIAVVGVGSQLFFFDRLANRTEAVFEDPTADERESERLFAYTEPFVHVLEHPRFLIIGEGNTISQTGGPSESAGKATHAVFAAGYYSYGMLTAFLIWYLILRALFVANRFRRKAKGTMAELQAQALTLSMLAILPWAVFGHAIVSTPRGTMIFFLQVGLVAALSRLPSRSTSKPLRPFNYVYRRNTAV
ncbi:MAG: O-antigen ligase family protein [Pseudomonadota bacterium]